MNKTSMITRRLLAVAAALTLASTGSVAQQAPASVLTGSGPNGATIRCRDGSYPAPMAADAACDGKGGVLVRFPMRAAPAPVARPAAPTRTQPAQVATPDSLKRPAGFVPWRERRAQAAAEAARQRPPAGATLRCGDGGWVVRDTSSARCASRGGVTLRVSQPAPRGGD